MRETKTYKVVGYVVLVIVTLILVYPVFNMVMLAFMPNDEINSIPLPFFPSKFTWDNFKHIISAFGYYEEDGVTHSYVSQFFSNTLYVIALNAIGMTISSTMCAYGFSKLKFVGRDLTFGILMATIMLPSAVTMIPLFTLFRDFGWLDTLHPITIPNFFGGGVMTIFLLRQYMKTLPDTLMEAARIDGASAFRVYWNIVLPNCKPIVFYNFLGVISSAWSDWFTPYLYINSKEKWTVPLAVANMAQSAKSYEVGSLGAKGVQIATGLVLCIVPLITYILGQKHYVDNVTLTGVKG